MKTDEQLQQEDFKKFKELRKKHRLHCAINQVLAGEKCSCKHKTINIQKVIREIEQRKNKKGY